VGENFSIAARATLVLAFTQLQYLISGFGFAGWRQLSIAGGYLYYCNKSTVYLGFSLTTTNTKL
jgi:hypothetical protein